MSPILHHYPPSLYSEKIRTLLGYLGLEWQSVTIPPIMPRPNLMPLSGGYRKTPIMQIGANVYCDSEIISRKLSALAGKASMFAPGFAAERVARWADTELFRIAVALNFRPQALAGQMNAMSSAEMQAFQKDRAELADGVAIVATNPVAAESHFAEILASLETSLTQDFLFGGEPSIADFSVYHNLWFVASNAANAPLVHRWRNVSNYLERMQAFGHGQFAEISSGDALSIGTDATPVRPEDAAVDEVVAGVIRAGDAVNVAADDYGRNPISGTLVSWQAHEIVIERNDPIAGAVMVHFPNAGFEVTQAG